jgi:flagellar hook-length control protein FliK
VAATGATKGAEAAPRGVELPFARANAALRTPSTAAAYRTPGTASAELLEQARDSIFKQVLMQLAPDGGEMRLTLQPPELGELDLKLVVEQGNRLELVIGADRRDLADLLQRHLDELERSLRQAGLEVTSTSVRTRSEFAREHGERRAPRDERGDAPTTEPTKTTARPRGYVRAQGLDFWA